MTATLLRLSVTLVLASLLGSAAYWKIRNRWEFVEAILSWRLLSPRGARAMSIALPLLETGTAASSIWLLVTNSTSAPATAPMAALFAVFVVGQLAILIRAKGAICGCSAVSGSVGSRSLARVGTLLFLAATPCALWLT